jgi:aspartate kinase
MTTLNQKPNLIVQKYGGATLATPERIKLAARRICALHRSGTQVVVVVSAMGQTTNELISLAHQVSARPLLRELDMLLTVGERISMSLLSMALNDLGCSAISYTGSQAGILTDEAHVNARIIDVKATRVEEALKENKVVIMAGFQGVSPLTKEITTLGRGGSDTSAVAMAGYLKASRCEILKDVDGVFSADPKLVKQAQVLTNLNYTHLLEMTSWGAKVLHQPSVEMAQHKNVTLYVGPAEAETSAGTIITAEFEFSSQKPIAVNSHAQVFEIDHPEDLQKFILLLKQNQMAKPQILFTQKKMHLISGPQEILNAIENFAKDQTTFHIIQKNISSVSLTYAKEISEVELKQVEKQLSEKKINIIQKFHSSYSLHFFVHTEQRNEVIQILHQLI